MPLGATLLKVAPQPSPCYRCHHQLLPSLHLGGGGCPLQCSKAQQLRGTSSSPQLLQQPEKSCTLQQPKIPMTIGRVPHDKQLCNTLSSAWPLQQSEGTGTACNGCLLLPPFLKRGRKEDEAWNRQSRRQTGDVPSSPPTHTPPECH